MLFDLTRPPLTDPTSVYRYRDGLYAADLLTAALVWLDFFSWLETQPSSHEQIAVHFTVADRPLDVMLTLFRSMGLLEKQGETFSLSPLAREHLTSSSPFFLGPYYASLKERPVCKDMIQVLRTDKPANWGSLKGEKEWARAMEDQAFAESFTAAMDCRGVYLGQAVAQKIDCSNRRNLLDIAGGSGIYACSLAAHFPQLRATVYEKPPVDGVAARAIARRGFSDRVRVKAGDMFAEEFPPGHDIHFISNVLHDWPFPVVESLLRKSYRSLGPGGLLIIHDAHINEDKSGPLPVASYSAMLMHSTEGKCYALSELFPLLAAIGFDRPHFIPTAADRSVITAAKP